MEAIILHGKKVCAVIKLLKKPQLAYAVILLIGSTSKDIAA